MVSTKVKKRIFLSSPHMSEEGYEMECCGFIGSRVVDTLLERRYEVIVVDDLRTGNITNIPYGQVNFFKCDIMSSSFEQIIHITEPDFIIHQAIDTPKNKTSNESFYNEHILSSIRLFDLAKKYAIQKVIFPSSGQVYGEADYVPIDTRHPVKQTDEYSIAKSTIELYVKFLGIDYTILRYSDVYGPLEAGSCEAGYITTFAPYIMQGKPIAMHPYQTRDFIFVDDVAEATVLALQKGRGQTLHVSTGIGTTLQDLISLMEQELHTSAQVHPKTLTNSEILHNVLENKETKELLQWEPKTNLQEGIRLSLCWERYLHYN
ncbi:NAD-dependent epimerase/dehydratase family protein [Gracilibacillus dipsosauri]|uniref:NAD-dependent epimerase/dehydratase family protein n=1 Tax=Gracilibacillus dipsosauri TaxID=178340 RepID=UPI0024095D6A